MNNLTYSTVIDQRSCDYTIFLKKPNFVDLLYGEDLSGGNAWAALCAANQKVGQFSESQILVHLSNKARTHFSKNLWWRLIIRSESVVMWNAIVRSTTNSVPAQCPLHHTIGYDSVPPLPLFRVRPRLATVFILGFLARLPFWFCMSVAVSGEFLLKGRNWRNS